jgi:hypothetical protein
VKEAKADVKGTKVAAKHTKAKAKHAAKTEAAKDTTVAAVTPAPAK